MIEEFLGSSSKVAIPGALWTAPGAPAGIVDRRRYASSIAGGEVEYLVYTPPGYDSSRRERYPVVYLLHRLGDSAASWVTNGGVDLTLNNLIAQRRVKPLVVVMPQCHPPNRVGLNPAAFEKSLFDELIPRIEAEYHVSRDATTRALAGVSAGGAQAEEQTTTDSSRALGQSLQAKGVRVVTAEVKEQGHVWRQLFCDFVQTLFP